MTNDLRQLVQDFYDYFLNLYQSTTEGGGEQAFLAFESIGTAVTPEMFVLKTGEFSPMLALEQFSTLANRLPILDGTKIKAPSIKTVDGLYDLMVVSAQPIPSVERYPFDKFRSMADEAFDRAIISPLILTGRRYCPAVATPPDWCAPQGVVGWTSKSFTHTDRIETKTQIGMPHPENSVTNQNWSLRVLPIALTPAIESPIAIQRVLPQLRMKILQEATIGEAPTHMVLKHKPESQTARPMRITAIPASSLRKAAPVISATQVAITNPIMTEPVQTHASTELHLDMANIAVNRPNEGAEATMIIRSEVLAAQTQALNAAASSQEITSSSLSLSFDYCLVTITRPWMSTEFLSIRSWYMQGVKAGDLSSGTGSGDAPFEVIPMAALIVKNLKIKADWLHSDQASIRDSVALGPFSLIGRSLDSVTSELTCPGMQIVGWICEPMPLLPPNGDPALL